MIDETTKYGYKYLSPSACVHGDYGGAGSVGVANVRAILEMEEFKDSIIRIGYREWENIDKWNDEFTEQWLIDEFKEDYGPPKVVHLTGGWGSNTIWLLECEETEDIIAALSDYPLLDEELHSQVEIEWEQEAWDSWLRSDLIHALPDDLADKVDGMQDDDLFTMYRKAMVDNNEYPTCEHAGVHVDVARIQDTFNDYIRESE